MRKFILSWIMIWSGYVLMGQQPVFLPNIVGQTLIDKANNGGPTTANNDQFGSAIANIGDLDQDGVEDIAVGANGDDNGGASSNNYGAVYICFMNSNKTVKSSVKIGKGTSGIGSDISVTDNFGCSVVGLGDLDGDGYLDIAVGAPNNDITSYSNSGAVYILFMDSTASILSYKKIVRGSHGGPTTIGTSSSFGAGLANIGDINGDGTIDLAVGGHNHDGPSGGTDNGAVWVLRMRKDGEVINNQIITKSTGWSGTLADFTLFGISLTSPGDLNNDGVNDLLVSAYGDDEVSSNLGAFYLLYLDSSGAAISYKKYKEPFFSDIFQYDTRSSFSRSLAATDINGDGQPEFIVGSFLEDDFFVIATDTAETIIDIKRYSTNQHWGLTYSGKGIGVSIALLNDIDLDGDLEIAVGAYTHDSPSLTDNGGVYIIDFDSVYTEINVGDMLLYDKYGNYSDSIARFLANDLFGGSVCDLGDVNGDGFHDIAVGAYQDDDGATNGNRGAVYIIFLDSLQQKISVQKISSTAGSFGTGLANNDNFGRSVCGPGDLDGDTIPDLIVGAWMDDDGASNRGAIWVIYLNSNGTVKSKHKISSTHGGFGGTLPSGCQFGCSVASIGDINNDGIGDLAVGANLDNDGGAGKGAVWILFMNAADSVSSYQKISDTQGDFMETFSGTNPSFGVSVCAAGDLNADGNEDIVVGANAMDGTGAVYVLYLDTLGNVITDQKINNVGSNFPITIQSSSNFGSAVTMLNDIDRNGYKEIVIGNVSYNPFGTNKGTVWIAFPDSAYNILSAKIIGEQAPYFNGNLELTDLFGRSLANYAAPDNSQRLFIGHRASEKSSMEGGVFMVYPSAMDSMSLRGLAFDITGISTHLKPTLKGFYDLNRTIDGGMYYPSGTKLQFKYYEEYRAGTMKYNIYHSDQTLLYAGTATPLYNEVTGTGNKSLGQNYFKLNLGLGGLNLATGNYILETINDKTEKMYLRFSYTKVTETPGPTVPVVLGP